MLSILMFAILAQPAAPAKPAATPVVSLSEAVAHAAADILNVPQLEQPTVRYLYFPEPTRENLAACAFALNTAVSHSSQIVRPLPVAGGRLLRIDLRALCPRDADFSRLLKLWEVNLADSDPYFHKPDVFIASDSGRPLRRIKVAPYRASNGKTFDYRAVEIIAADQFGLHVGLQNLLLVHSLTGSNLPVVRADWFVVKSLTTLDGGLYYQFMGIAGLNRNQFFESIGADLNAVAKRRSDQRAAIGISEITGKPRLTNFVPTVGVRPTVGQGILVFTEDIFDEDNDPERHPIYTLLGFKSRAEEHIFQRPNGMLGYALFDSDGKLQNAVPDNIARDGTIPPPYTAKLQPAIGCIRCHSPHSGWQPCPNDILSMLKPIEVNGKLERLDIFDDENSKENVTATVDRLAGLYSASFDQLLMTARRDHDRAAFELLGGPLKAKSISIVADVSAAIRAMHDNYSLSSVTAAKAAKELGVADFGKAVPLMPHNAAGVRPEDPTLWRLRQGKPVTRKDWERTFGDAATRAAIGQLGLGIAP